MENLDTLKMEYSSEIITFILSVAVSYLAVRWKIRKELDAMYDRTLREYRLPVYQRLWESLQPLSKYSPPAPVTHKIVTDLSIRLREWYYLEGGLYLSKKAQKAYVQLQGEMKETAGSSESSNVLNEKTLNKLFNAGSTLRTAMAFDVGTRKAPMLKFKA